MKSCRVKIRNVAKIGLVCIVVSIFVACSDKCKEVNSNFETEYAKYNTLRVQFNEHMVECMQIAGFEDAYISNLSIGGQWATSFVAVINVYEDWSADTERWRNLTTTQQQVILNTYDAAIKAREQGNICQEMVNDNPDCLGDKDEFNMIC